MESLYQTLNIFLKGWISLQIPDLQQPSRSLVSKGALGREKGSLIPSVIKKSKTIFFLKEVKAFKSIFIALVL